MSWKKLDEINNENEIIAPLSLAVPAMAAGIVYAPAVVSSGLAAADVATMGYTATTLSSGTAVIVSGIGRVSRLIPELNQLTQKAVSTNKPITGIIRSDGTVEAHIQNVSGTISHKSLGLTKNDLGFNMSYFDGNWYISPSGYATDPANGWAKPSPAEQEYIRTVFGVNK
ncbi:hypothetical protein [Paenibacillus sp. NPDC058071]|uniref:hypothetical protein n=1 Tax=Paenibacillus sp. NPDC058071 TaxID=3346326 RepID=UPI0036DBB1C6